MTSVETSSLKRLLRSDALFLMHRNSLSALKNSVDAEFDDNGWISCLQGITGLRKFLKTSFETPKPEFVVAAANTLTSEKPMALFWGIFDLKYDANKPIFERVQVLETGDGRESQFSHHGAPLSQRYRNRYTPCHASLGRQGVLAGNKMLTSDVIEDAGYRNLLPKQAFYRRVYYHDLAERIINDLEVDPDEMLVLKLLTRCRGAGVLPVSVAELDQALQDYLVHPLDIEGYLDKKLQDGPLAVTNVDRGSYQEHRMHWWSNECPQFVVQRFCSSTPVVSQADGKEYDGTMRIAFALRARTRHIEKWQMDKALVNLPEPQDLALDWLGGYWKLPYDDVFSLADDNNAVRRGCVSAARTAGTAPVSENLLHEVCAALCDVPLVLFGGSEPSLTTLRKRYHKSAFEVYLNARFALTDDVFSEGSPQKLLDTAKSMMEQVTPPRSRRHVEAFIYRIQGCLEIEHKRWEASREWFQRSIDSMPTNANSYYFLGTAALKLDDPWTAVRLLSRSLVLDPDFKAAYMNLRTALFRLGREDDAEEIWEALCKRFPCADDARPDHVVVAHFRRGGKRAAAIQNGNKP